MRNFRKYNFLKNGIEIVKDAYQISKLLPSDEKFGLRSLVTRTAISIPSNIAEGSSRNSDLDFKRFLEIAMGSAFELETQLILIEELKLCPVEKLSQIKEKLLNEQKMINKFIEKLKS